jgi:hypothetical protein
MSSSAPARAVDMHRYLKQSLEILFKNNRDWSASKRSTDPAFFDKLADGQAPKYLWVARPGFVSLPQLRIFS